MAGPSLVERLDKMEKLLEHIITQVETAAGVIQTGAITAFDPLAYTATVLLADGRTMTGAIVDANLRLDLCIVGRTCRVDVFGDTCYVTGIVGVVPADPFDPITGHKHRGLLHDGPTL